MNASEYGREPTEWAQPDATESYCRHPGHEPPHHMVITRRFRHVCPACGKVTVIHPTVVQL